MQIGLISGTKHLAVRQGRAIWDVYGFSFSGSDLSFFELMSSAFATPARYVWELFRRLDALQDGKDRRSLFIFNPLFHTSIVSLQRVLQTLSNGIDLSCMSVVVDAQSRPIGYLFPATTAPSRLHVLSLLSTVDGRIDARLLALLFQCRVEIHQIDDVSLTRAHHNGFLFKSVRSIYLDLARLAIRRLESGSVEGLGSSTNRPIFTALMPRHAGDVLFFSLAYSSGTTHIDRVAVQSVYADIVARVAPRLSVLCIEGTPDGCAASDVAHFEAYRSTLALDGFYYFARQSRDGNATGFHLIDHFAFALGHPCWNSSELPSRRAMPPFAPYQSPTPVKLLLHFDGGWPLKIYPDHFQEQLIELLQARGYSLTLLTSRRSSHPRCEVVEFSSLTDFTHRVEHVHLVIGMDSFPAHFSAYILGKPTICLFGNTRPANAVSGGMDFHRALERGLPCRPCNAVATCPRDGSSACGNFVSPGDVLGEVERLLRTCSSVLDESATAIPSSRFVDPCSAAPPALRQKTVHTVTLRGLALRARLVGVFEPYVSFLALLWTEYKATVRLDGRAGAWWRARRFLRRIARRDTRR